jgi:hypothetical protein
MTNAWVDRAFMRDDEWQVVAIRIDEMQKSHNGAPLSNPTEWEALSTACDSDPDRMRAERAALWHIFEGVASETNSERVPHNVAISKIVY